MKPSLQKQGSLSLHQNPVEAGLVFHAEDYRYSSAIDYCDEKGLLDNVVVLECLIDNIETTRKDSCGRVGTLYFIRPAFSIRLTISIIT